MKIDRICFEQLFPTGAYANMRLRVEATVDEIENISECYKKLQQEVENAFVKLNPQIKWEEQRVADGTGMREGFAASDMTPEQRKEAQIKNFIEAINTSTSLKAVEIFRKLVERENNIQLTEAFNNKLKSFQ